MTLAALVTVGGIFAVTIGVMQVVTSFQVKHLPQDVDKAFSETFANGAAAHTAPATPSPASAN